MSTLDLTTLNCPWTIIQTKQAMEQLSVGDNLLVLVKDPSFIIDCKAYTRKTGNKLISSWSTGEKIFCLLKKS